MTRSKSPLPPLQNLALTHAKREFRLPLGFLLNLDNRLYSVATRGSEPLLAQMRIAWWREQLAKPETQRPVGEPLLAEYGAIISRHADLNISASADELLNAWEIIAITQERGSPDQLRQFANHRSRAIFERYATWIAATQNERASAFVVGQNWALNCLGRGQRHSVKKSTNIRPLSILAKGAELELVTSTWGRSLGAVRLGIHALTGL